MSSSAPAPATTPTPTPWRLVKRRHGTCILITGQFGAKIATVHPRTGNDIRDANANLLVHAPDLLRCLREMVAYYGATELPHLTRLHPIQLARKAIAAAEGRAAVEALT